MAIATRCGMCSVQYCTTFEIIVVVSKGSSNELEMDRVCKALCSPPLIYRNNNKTNKQKLII